MKDGVKENRLFVITGGPGSGKTTLIEALASRGFKKSIESGRAIIKDQLMIGGNALPWSNPLTFAELMMRLDLQSYELARNSSDPVVFDRGIPDVIGYLNLMKLPVSEYMEKAACSNRYNHNVFIAPPWPEIYTHDSERKQTFEEARATYDALVETYLAYGYNLLSLPLASVEERVQFVIKRML